MYILSYLSRMLFFFFFTHWSEPDITLNLSHEPIRFHFYYGYNFSSSCSKLCISESRNKCVHFANFKCLWKRLLFPMDAVLARNWLHTRYDDCTSVTLRMDLPWTRFIYYSPAVPRLFSWICFVSSSNLRMKTKSWPQKNAMKSLRAYKRKELMFPWIPSKGEFSAKIVPSYLATVRNWPQTLILLL